MDAVELPLPAAIVTKIMRSSGCSGGGGVTRVELVGSQSERETYSSCFQPEKDENRNVIGSRPAFWNKISDEDLYRQTSQLSSLCNEEVSIDNDMTSLPEAKQSQRKSGKAARSNGNSSRRSRAAHMEATLNVTGAVDMNDLPKELGSYPGKCNTTEKIQNKQKSSVSGKRSDKRNGKVPKSKCDSFSVKAGLSSFSSAAGGNNILGAYGSKQDIYDFAKHVDELPLNELLDGSYKHPQFVKDKEKKTEVSNRSILQSVREVCSILQLQKPIQTLNVADVDGTINHNASSSLPNSGTSGASRTDDNIGDEADPSSCNKVDDSCSVLTNHANILKFPLFAPKDVLGRLALPPPKDLDLMLLDSMKPSLTSKVQSGGSLPTFPWSHISGGHFKANPDVVKSTPSKNTCQGRWVKIVNLTTSLGDTTTTYLADFKSLTYNQSLVPLGCQQPVPTEKEKSPLPSISDTTFQRGLMPSGTHETAPKIPGHSAGVLAAAQTLCDIASRFRKHDQNITSRWHKKSSQKSIKPSKLKSDEKLEKALFAIPTSRPMGPTNPITTPKKLKLSINEPINPTKTHFNWSTTTPQSSRSSPKPFKNTPIEPKNNPLKRSITSPPARLLNKPPKLRKLVPMEWKSRVDQKGNTKY